MKVRPPPNQALCDVRRLDCLKRIKALRIELIGMEVSHHRESPGVHPLNNTPDESGRHESNVASSRYWKPYSADWKGRKRKLDDLSPTGKGVPAYIRRKPRDPVAAMMNGG